MFRKRLKRYLQAEEISVKDFSKSIGRSVDSVKGYLNSDTVPKVDVILAISIKFPHWSVKHLLTGEGNPYQDKIQETEKSPPKANHKKTVLKWLALRNRLAFEVNTLPLEGMHLLFDETLTRLEELLRENEAMAIEIDALYEHPLPS